MNEQKTRKGPRERGKKKHRRKHYQCLEFNSTKDMDTSSIDHSSSTASVLTSTSVNDGQVKPPTHGLKLRLIKPDEIRNSTSANMVIPTAEESKLAVDSVQQPKRLQIDNLNSPSDAPPVHTLRPGLRRTPRRIILRIKKDFLFHNQIGKMKKSTGKKSSKRCKKKKVKDLEDKTTAAIKEKPILDSNGIEKKKRGRKSNKKIDEESIFNLGKINNPPRGRGRPPKNQCLALPASKNSYPFLEGGKLIRIAKKPIARSKTKTCWNVIPKECQQTNFNPFKVLRISPPDQAMRILSCNMKSFSNKIPYQEVDSQFGIRKPHLQIRKIFGNPISNTKVSTRPTVIYFSGQKNDKANSSTTNDGNDLRKPIVDYRVEEMHQHSPISNQFQMTNAALLNSTEGSTRSSYAERLDVLTEMSDRKEFLSNYNGYLRRMSLPMNAVIGCNNYSSNGNCYPNHSHSSIKVYSTDEIDTMSRKLIIESIRLLYDDQAVLG